MVQSVPKINPATTTRLSPDGFVAISAQSFGAGGVAMPEVVPRTSDAMRAWEAWIDQAGVFSVTSMSLTIKHHPGDNFYVALEITALKHGDLMLTMQSAHITIGSYALIVDASRKRLSEPQIYPPSAIRGPGRT